MIRYKYWEIQGTTANASGVSDYMFSTMWLKPWQIGSEQIRQSKDAIVHNTTNKMIVGEYSDSLIGNDYW